MSDRTIIKNRLIKLINELRIDNEISITDLESGVLRDHLLVNGCVCPPCNVGDTVYRTMVYNDKLVSWKIVKMEVFEDEMGFVDDSDNWIAFDEIGKTVFLTKEEAEQALKKAVQSDD